jgi:hypothetical protein
MRRPAHVIVVAALVLAVLPVLDRLVPAPAGSQVPPASCGEVRTLNPAASDSDYIIVANGRTLSVYCHDMAGTPKEYITLRQTAADHNFSQYTHGGASPGSDVRTTFTKVRLDPASLVVDVGDLTFASSTGELQHSSLTGGPSSPYVRSMPYGEGMSCTKLPDGIGNVDLRGTPYAVADPFGVRTVTGSGSATKSAGDQVVDLLVSGYCGWVAPAPADAVSPFNPAPGDFRLDLKCAPDGVDAGGGVCQEVLPATTTSATSTTTTTTTTTTTSTTTTTTTAPPPAPAPSPRDTGYWLVGREGKVYPFGQAGRLGDGEGKIPAGTDAVDIEATPSRNGFWILAGRGQVIPVGDAAKLPSLDSGDLAAGESPVSLAATRSGAGYWIFTSTGRVHPFGDARSFGDLAGVVLTAPIRAGVASSGGGGYYLTGADGGVFTFGDARFSGSLAGRRLQAPVVSLALDPDGSGYWLAAADGGVFGFDAAFRGSLPPNALNGPVVGAETYGDGYALVASDGGVFVFSDRPFHGSLGQHPPPNRITALAVH